MKHYNRGHKPHRHLRSRSKYGIEEVIKLRKERGVGSVRKIRKITEVSSFIMKEPS